MTTVRNAALKVLDEMNIMRVKVNSIEPFGMYQMLMEFKQIEGDHLLVSPLTPKLPTNQLNKSVFSSNIAFH